MIALLFGMQEGGRKEIVLVPSMPRDGIPVVNLPSSLAKLWRHVAASEVVRRCRYSMVCPVVGHVTAEA